MLRLGALRASLVFLVVLAGCGARTGLTVPDPASTRPDAAARDATARDGAPDVVVLPDVVPRDVALDVVVDESSPVIQLSAGQTSACALHASGQVQCWGGNAHGELGNPAVTASHALPVPVVGLGHATQIASGDDFTCAATDTGVFCWGNNAQGQLAGTAAAQSAVPVQVPGIEHVIALAAGGAHACALVTDPLIDVYHVWCWGLNRAGEFGPDAPLGDHVAPVENPAFVQSLYVAVGAAFVCGSHTSEIRCCGDGFDGELGDGVPHATSSPVTVDFRISASTSYANHPFAARAHHACAIGYTGAVPTSGASVAFCWGLNDHGELGDGTTTERTAPVPIRPFSYPTGLGNDTDDEDWVAAGNTHSCVGISQDGVWCWGDNSRGQLGDGTTVDRASPTLALGLSPTSGAIVSVVAGGAFTCALRTTYTTSTPITAVECWGANDSGQLGDGTTVDRPTPTMVQGL